MFIGQTTAPQKSSWFTSRNGADSCSGKPGTRRPHQSSNPVQYNPVFCNSQPPPIYLLHVHNPQIQSSSSSLAFPSRIQRRYSQGKATNTAYTCCSPAQPNKRRPPVLYVLYEYESACATIATRPYLAPIHTCGIPSCDTCQELESEGCLLRIAPCH